MYILVHDDLFFSCTISKDVSFVFSEEESKGDSEPSSVHIVLGDITHVDRIDVSIPYVGEALLIGPLSARRRLIVSGL